MENRGRRNFLKLAGISAFTLATKPVRNAVASSAGSNESAPAEMIKNEKALVADHWGMVIDTRKLETEADLYPMIEACHKIHNVPVNIKNRNHEIKWIWSEEFGHAFPLTDLEYVNKKAEHLPFLVLCNHCENPPCVRVCPTKATFQREDGIVMMDFHRCIGCRFCMAGCPYGSRSFNFKDPRPFIEKINPEFPTRMKGVVEKCNFCAERLAVGLRPACVEASNGALLFGDLSDPESEVRKALEENYAIRRKPSLGTGPSVYYIL